MSFAMTKPEGRRSVVATLADIVAAARLHRLGPAGAALGASFPRGRGDARNDPVLALAHLLAPSRGGLIDAASLAGSFHPLVARQIMVGKRR